MTLLETITKASTNGQPSPNLSKYPIPLNAGPILKSLIPDPEVINPNPISLVHPLTGFLIPDYQLELAAFNTRYAKLLKKKLKDGPASLSTSAFYDSLLNFLKEIKEKALPEINIDGEDQIFFASKLLVLVGGLIGKDVIGLIVESCIVLNQWRLLETLIANNLVGHGYCSNLVYNLTVKRRSDLLCLCMKHFSDLNSGDLCWLLKYFLSPSKEAYDTMTSVRKEWESQALFSIEKASNTEEKDIGLAKQAAIILMMAYDGFSTNELCLHYLLSTSTIDEVVFAYAISKLNVEEMLGLIRYLGKWLRKYERFPQAVPCPRAVPVFGLIGCQWVPKLEEVVKALGFVLDEHFPSLVLHSEFHEELRGIEGVVGCFVSEGRLCHTMANMIKVINPQVKDEV